METSTRFADWMRQRRQALDISQAVLAERVGCAAVTIRKIEQETRRPSRELAELLADHLAIPTAQREAFLQLARGERVERMASAATLAAAPAILESANQESSAAPVVARELELSQLDSHLIATLNGSGRIVFVTGEAGRGKTTLMAEFVRRAQERYSDLVVANGNCDAYAGAGDPYLPFRDIMAQLTGDIEAKWKAGGFSQEQAHRLWALIPWAVQELVDRGPDLLDIFVAASGLLERARANAGQGPGSWMRLQARLERQQSHPRSGRQRQLFEQYTQVLCALATRHPLLLVLDDLQWIDSASAGLLFHLGRRLPNSRILVLSAYRPSEVALNAFDADEQAGTHPLFPVIQELKRRYGDVEIDLEGLDTQAGRAFVDALLDIDPNRLDETFRAALARRTQGHPLFTVELRREMQEQRALIPDKAGYWIEQEGHIDWEALPSRVEAVIAWRIGRLPFHLQETLKVAAVEGEAFTAEVAARVQGMDEQQMVRQLSSVIERQHHLIRNEGSARLGQQALSRYRFGHILFRDYLYETLSGAEQVYLHEAVGNALEALYAEELENVADRLAYHFQAAGLSAEAIAYLYLAGQRAVQLCAHKEAIVYFSSGLALLESLPETVARSRQELRFQIALGISLATVRGWAAAEAGHAYERARVLAQQLAETSQLGSILWGLYVFYTVQGNLHTAHALGEQCLRLAQAQDDSPLRVVSHFMVGVPSFHLGRLKVAQAHLEQGRAAYLPGKHLTYISHYGPDFGVFSSSYQAHFLWYLGYPEQALQQMQTTLALAESLDHPYSLAVAQSYAAMLHQLRRESSAAQTWAKTTLVLCAEHEFSYYATWATLIQGWAMAEQGDSDAGIVQMQQGLAALRAMGAGLRESYYLGLLAEAHAKAGQVEEGLGLLDEALALTHARGERCHEAGLYQLRGKLLSLQGESGCRVEECFLYAADVANKQGAKSLELRALLSLGRLWQRQGKAETARQRLATIYKWFTEGFDTLDLQEAKALLDELA